MRSRDIRSTISMLGIGAAMIWGPHFAPAANSATGFHLEEAGEGHTV